jgi:DNA-binding LacI/PurR family transcriptional regulator
VLFQNQRQERLLVELRRSGAVRVRDLALDLGVSELTIRRDIAALAARNLVTRVHGGATLPLSRPGRRPAPTSFTIGMVVPSLDFYWPPVVAGARAAAAALGVRVQLRGSSYDPAEDRRQIGRLVADGQVQGLLLAPTLDGDDEMIDWIGRLPVPAILVERQPVRPRPISWVRSDHALGLETAVRHLREHGHHHIDLLLDPGSPTSDYLARAWPGVARTPADLSEVLAGGATALIVHSDPHAIAVAQNCADRGAAPAIVSYDDEVAHLADPPLTAVRPPKNHVGRLAVELMVSRLLDGDRRPAQGVLVAPELVVRQSSVMFASVRF